jgi:hypothetical protein
MVFVMPLSTCHVWVRCNVHIRLQDNRATRIYDTITWFPTKITTVVVTAADLLLSGIQYIQHTLLQHTPVLHLTHSPVTVLNQLAEVLISNTVHSDDTRLLS